ncbi:hypothetical protein A2U01_0107262, partial [Trifolium medium]|nr:hypothetical protein [Trifolium medium]
AVHQSMYQLHLQGPVMSPDDFHTHNNWPGDRPQFGEGAGTNADDAGDAGDDGDDAEQVASDASMDEGEGDG